MYMMRKNAQHAGRSIGAMTAYNDPRKKINIVTPGIRCIGVSSGRAHSNIFALGGATFARILYEVYFIQKEKSFGNRINSNVVACAKRKRTNLKKNVEHANV